MSDFASHDDYLAAVEAEQSREDAEAVARKAIEAEADATGRDPADVIHDYMGMAVAAAFGMEPK